MSAQGSGKHVAIQRIVARIAVTDFGCWIWQRALDEDGYGRMSFGGRKSLPAHCVAYEAFIGDVPDELELDHLCRNHACVNPWHLEPVTHPENVQRGISGVVNGARMRARTHCKRGHPYTPDNTRIDSRGARVCLICKRDWTREKRKKRQEAAA